VQFPPEKTADILIAYKAVAHERIVPTDESGNPVKVGDPRFFEPDGIYEAVTELVTFAIEDTDELNQLGIEVVEFSWPSEET
jgi:hypothetical protein